MSSSRTKALSSAGVFAAAMIAVLVNVLANRHYRRWDATRAQIYSLSEPTKYTLQQLEREARDVEIFIFIGSGDPLLSSVKAMLMNYQALAPRHLIIRYLDPDRERAEFLRLQSELDVHAGKAEGGRILSDAQIVVRHANRLWYVKTDDLVVLDEGDDAKARPRVEQSITGAIRAVLATDRPRVCFTSGHGEPVIEDPGNAGLSTLKNTLAKDNYEPVSIDLSKLAKPGTAQQGVAPSLQSCLLVAIVSPSEAFAPHETKVVIDAVNGGSSLLLVAAPMIDVELKALRPHGLAEVAALAGTVLEDAVTIEGDPALREPNELGLVFRARVMPHSTTDELRKFVESKGGEANVPLKFVRPLRRMETGTANPQPLLASSPKSFSLHDIAGFLSSKEEAKRGPTDREGPLELAMAVERPKLANRPRGARIVISGTSTPFVNAAFSDPSPAMTFTRTLGLLWLSWLAARPPILDMPPKSSVQIAMHLSEEDLSAIGRYVLLYMPVSTALLGGAVWMRRRTTEGKRLRRKATEKDERD